MQVDRFLSTLRGLLAQCYDLRLSSEFERLGIADIETCNQDRTQENTMGYGSGGIECRRIPTQATRYLL